MGLVRILRIIDAGRDQIASGSSVMPMGMPMTVVRRMPHRRVPLILRAMNVAMIKKSTIASMPEGPCQQAIARLGESGIAEAQFRDEEADGCTD